MEINRLFGMLKMNGNDKLHKMEVPKKDISYLEQGGGLDTVEFSSVKKQNWQTIAEEWREYTDSIWGKPEPEFSSREEREHYWITYYDNYINYCDRVLACDDLPEDMKAEWQRMKSNAMVDRNNHYRDLNNWKKENNMQTESFNDVYAEMCNNVPDRTTTIDEKRLALSYINRMLSCQNIPNAEYWQNKKAVIEMEIQNIENSKVQSGTEQVADVWNEFSEFIDKYFGSINDNMTIEEKYENRLTYYSTYKSFIQRLLNCTDITENLRQEYLRMDANANLDLSRWQIEYVRNRNY